MKDGIVAFNGKRGGEKAADCGIVEFAAFVNRIGDFGGVGAIVFRE